MSRARWLLFAGGSVAAILAAILSPASAAAAAKQDWPPFVLVTGLLVLGLVADREGLFEVAGSALSKVASSSWTLFLGAALLVAVTTALLNLDTAVVFLTPVLVRTARRHGSDEVPFLYLAIMMANGASLGKQTVTVNEPKQQVQSVAPPVINTPAPAAKPTGPDLAALMPALSAYKSVFAAASGKSRKDCQTALSGKFQGKLQELAQAWCDAAKRFDASEQGCQVGGSSDSPTLACTETITVYPKDGDPKQYRSKKTFYLSGEQGGTWEIAGW